MLLKTIIVTCCLQMQKSRTISAIYHLLKGKRSIQTFQDAHIFQLTCYFGICKSLKKQTFNKHVNDLVKMNIVVLNKDSSFYVRDQAADSFKKKHHFFPLNYFNGLRYANTTDTFFYRLVLLVQTLANSQMNHFSFIPVVDDRKITSWVKTFYKRTASKHDMLMNRLYLELKDVLSQLSDRDADVFVQRLSGYNNYGKSIGQLAAAYNIDQTDVIILMNGICHRLLDIIHYDKKRYKTLYTLVEDISPPVFITDSAQKTKRLILHNYTIEDVAKYRNLKINTIYDHIVEWALNDNQFPIENYVTDADRKAIIRAIQKAQSFKLKDIKQLVHDDITYFQIRLVIAVTKGKIGSGDMYGGKY
ncbi:MAG TPA: helix-turn-helix domain-containing protein [Bacillota bacterium]|nr:helix-turn-helix domain-containing protein [Bacillota bacterium]